jgi:hypothetical protein
MSAELQDLINFHLTGQHRQSEGNDARLAAIVPALLATYRDLTELRYDFPMVLLDDATSPAYVDSLSGIISRLLRDIAPHGNTGEQLRQNVLKLETQMRKLVADGYSGSIEEAWKKAEKSLLTKSRKQDKEQLRNNLSTARFALKTGGEVVDCDDRLPTRVITSAWNRNELQRARETLGKITVLAIRMRDMLRVDDLKTDNSRTPAELRKQVGKPFKDAFDFELMSELLGDSTPSNHLPADRRKRIRETLDILEAQRFFNAPRGGDSSKSHQFLFNNLPSALKAYNERLPDLAKVVKAMAVAELECDNAYCPDEHDTYFSRFGPEALTPEDLALFPSYLVTLHESDCSSLDTTRLMEMVSCDLPIKVLIQVSDAFGGQPATNAELYTGSFVQQLAHTLMAPGDAYILQTSSAYLARHQAQLRRGLEFHGPAIFSVFAPKTSEKAALPDYLVAAAALEARVFPAFSYDPSAGSGLADRFDISQNPQASQDWPQRELQFEDSKLQTVRQTTAFTPADFALTAPGMHHHFEIAPVESEKEKLVPISEYLDLPAGECRNKVPYVAAVDADNLLLCLVMDEHMVRRVRRCRERWHSLQELGGEHNSYASAAIAEAAATAEETAAPTVQDAPAEIEAEPQIEIDDADAADEEVVASSDDAYIETPRCTTCDECTNRNDRMFAYDDNKQAYIKDPDAGTYRDLVEAAELCQVSIIHPGKPRNPDEPGLADLIARAEPFQD